MEKRSYSFISHLGAVFALPFTAAVVVPWLILPKLPENLLGPFPWGTFLFLAGLALFSAGVFLLVATLSLFVRVGRGTLAPWAPTQKLVAVGIYRHTRNPMISGVMAVLLAEACWFRSWHGAAWAVIFFVFNHIYFIASEEPGLEKRFGEEYRKYKREVPRWLPRLKA